MSEESKTWEYWKEPDFPECKHDWGGVNSNPDHCLDCCGRTEKYLLGKLAAVMRERDEIYEVRNHVVRHHAALEEKLVAVTKERDELAEDARLRGVLYEDLRFPTRQRMREEISALSEREARYREFIKNGVECKCDTLSDGGWTCPRCELLALPAPASSPVLRAREKELEDLVLAIRDKWVPALLRDALEADKTDCNAQSIRYAIARVLPEHSHPPTKNCWCGK